MVQVLVNRETQEKEETKQMATTQDQVDAAYNDLAPKAITKRNAAGIAAEANSAATVANNAFNQAFDTYVALVNAANSTQEQIDSAYANLKVKETARIQANIDLLAANATAAGAGPAFTAAANAYKTLVNNICSGT